MNKNKNSANTVVNTPRAIKLMASAMGVVTDSLGKKTICGKGQILGNLLPSGKLVLIKGIIPTRNKETKSTDFILESRYYNLKAGDAPVILHIEKRPTHTVFRLSRLFIPGSNKFQVSTPREWQNMSMMFQVDLAKSDKDAVYAYEAFTGMVVPNYTKKNLQKPQPKAFCKDPVLDTLLTNLENYFASGMTKKPGKMVIRQEVVCG